MAYRRWDVSKCPSSMDATPKGLTSLFIWMQNHCGGGSVMLGKGRPLSQNSWGFNPHQYFFRDNLGFQDTNKTMSLSVKSPVSKHHLSTVQKLDGATCFSIWTTMYEFIAARSQACMFNVQPNLTGDSWWFWKSSDLAVGRWKGWGCQLSKIWQAALESAPMYRSRGLLWQSGSVPLCTDHEGCFGRQGQHPCTEQIQSTTTAVRGQHIQRVTMAVRSQHIQRAAMTIRGQHIQRAATAVRGQHIQRAARAVRGQHIWRAGTAVRAQYPWEDPQCYFSSQAPHVKGQQCEAGLNSKAVSW